MRLVLSSLTLSAIATLAACQSPSADNSVAVPARPASVNAPKPASPSSPPVTQQVPKKFRAGGTEPFWGVDVDGERLLYTTPENMQGTRLTAKPVVSANGTRYAGTENGKPFSLEIREAGTCSDGMSEIDYRYTATFSFDGRDLKGCAKEVP